MQFQLLKLNLHHSLNFKLHLHHAYMNLKLNLHHACKQGGGGMIFQTERPRGVNNREVFEHKFNYLDHILYARH